MSIRVEAIGPLDAPAVFIGEAPAAEECARLEPFVGEAGRELNSWFGFTGLIREQLRITNIRKERAPNDNMGVFARLTKPTKQKPIESAPRWEEWLESVEELRQELSLCTANVLVPLGNYPLYALTGLRGIGKYRGSILESTLLPGRKVIPTYHPAGVRRNFMNRYYAIQDLMRIKLDMQFPELRLPERGFTIEPSFECVCGRLQELLIDDPGDRVLGLDLEMINDEVSHVGLSWDSAEAMSIPFLKPWENVWTPDQEADILQLLTHVLKRYPVCAQNIGYDAFVLWRKYGIRVNVQHDTGIAHHLAFPDLLKSLEILCSLYTREPFYKFEGQFWNVRNWDQRRASVYNCKDVVVLQDIMPKVQKELKWRRNTELYTKTMRLMHPILFMQARGIKIDMKVREELAEEYGKKEKTALKALDEDLGFKLNPNSSDQCIAYFYGKKNWQLYKRKKPASIILDIFPHARNHKPYFKKKSVTVDEDALVRLLVKGEKAAQFILDARRARKALSTFILFNMDPDQRLRSSFDPTAVSGRLKSSKFLWGTGMNQQNFPKKIRRMWIPDDGYVAFGVDLINADLRAVANFANERVMIQAFENREDVHSLTAAQMLNKPIEQISREVGSSPYHGRPDDSERDAAGKRPNLALGYDMSARTAALNWEMPESQAGPIVDRWHRIYPNIRAVFHREVQAQLGENRTLTNPMGRHRRFLGRWGRELFKDGYNWMGQSTVSDVINWRGLLFIYENQQWFRYIELLNQIHDEVCFQIPLSQGWVRMSEMILRVRDSLQLPLFWKGREFFIPAELKLGHAFYPMKELDIQDIGSAVTLGVQLKEMWNG